MNKKFFYILIFFLTISAVPASLFAFQVGKIEGLPLSNDFVITPAKFDIEIDPGSSADNYIKVTNRSADPAEFKIDFQDIVYSGDPQSPLKESALPATINSLSKYIYADKNKFILESREQAIVTLRLDIPKDFKGNSLEGAVMVSGRKVSDMAGGASTKLIAELGSIFSVKVKNGGLEKGQFASFSFKDEKFSVRFVNAGEVPLSPYGIIVLRDVLGREAGKIVVSPTLVLPNSERIIETPWGSSGWSAYKATAIIYPGYGGMENIETMELWVRKDRTAMLVVVIFATILLFIIGRKKFKKKKK